MKKINYSASEMSALGMFGAQSCFLLFHNMLGNTINKDEVTQSNNNIAESLTRPNWLLVVCL